MNPDRKGWVVAVCIVATLLLVALFCATRPAHVHVYVVSLRRKEGRRARMSRQASGVQFVDAIDGRDLEAGVDHLSRGELACFHSHVLAWRHVVDTVRDQDFCLVLEDDADVKLPSAMAEVRTLVAACPPDWDLLFLGLNNPPKDAECVARGERRSIKRVAGDTWGLHAIALRGRGARKLLGAWDRLGVKDPSGNTCPADVWVSRVPGIKAYWVDPVLVKPFDIRDSETQRIR